MYTKSTHQTSKGKTLKEQPQKKKEKKKKESNFKFHL